MLGKIELKKISKQKTQMSYQFFLVHDKKYIILTSFISSSRDLLQIKRTTELIPLKETQPMNARNPDYSLMKTVFIFLIIFNCKSKNEINV